MLMFAWERALGHSLLWALWPLWLPWIKTIIRVHVLRDGCFDFAHLLGIHGSGFCDSRVDRGLIGAGASSSYLSCHILPRHRPQANSVPLPKEHLPVVHRWRSNMESASTSEKAATGDTHQEHGGKANHQHLCPPLKSESIGTAGQVLSKSSGCIRAACCIFPW